MLVETAGVLETQVAARTGVLRPLRAAMFPDMPRQALLPLVLLTAHVATEHFIRGSSDAAATANVTACTRNGGGNTGCARCIYIQSAC